MTRRPIAGLLFCWLVGTASGARIAAPDVNILAGSIVFLLSAMLFSGLDRSRKHPVIGHAAMYAGILLLACFNASLKSVEPQNNLFHDWSAKQQVRITGVVAGSVRSRRVAGGTRQMSLFSVKVKSFNGADQHRPFPRMEVSLFSYPSEKQPRSGQTWALKGDYGRKETKGRSFGPRLTADMRDCRIISDETRFSYIRWCRKMRGAASRKLSIGIEEHETVINILNAIVLGYREQLPDQSEKLFAAVGTLHIFAVSGLHVGIIAMFLIFIFKAMKLPRYTWILLMAPLLVTYTVITGVRASAVRACIMALVYYAAPFIRRRSDAASAVAAAALLILAASPGQLFEIGFIYSFIVVTGLILIYPLFYAPLHRMTAPDPFRIQPERKSVTWIRTAARRAASLIAVSWAAWISSAPLTAYYFGRFSPIALLSNIVVVPLAFFIVLTGCLSVLLGSCLNVFSEIFNYANLGLVSGLLWFADKMNSVPFGSMTAEKPGLGWVLLWYTAIIACCLYFRIDMRTRSLDRPEIEC
ncbi:MAG: ComEC/Rec2 family competence protein [Kiritimatiellia bacterium]